MKYYKALDYYAEEDFTRAQGLFEQLKPILKGTKQADTVYFYAAYCSYYEKSYLLASHYFDEFTRIYGNSSFVEEASFMSAYCTYKLSPKVTLDQSYTYQAISRFSLFISKYPYTDRKDECIDIVGELRNKLIEKAFLSAKLYYDLSEYQPAIVALNNCLDDFPETEHREEIMFMILKSKYLLAENSVVDKQVERYQSTVDEYYAFNGEFPDSKFANEAENIFIRSQDWLKN